MNEWIKLENGLPEEEQDVLVYGEELRCVEIATLKIKPSGIREWQRDCDCDEPFGDNQVNGVSHWMRLPGAPK